MSRADMHLLLFNWSTLEREWQAVYETVVNFRWFLIMEAVSYSN